MRLVSLTITRFYKSEEGLQAAISADNMVFDVDLFIDPEIIGKAYDSLGTSVESFPYKLEPMTLEEIDEYLKKQRDGDQEDYTSNEEYDSYNDDA